jgi:hypothetical protein
MAKLDSLMGRGAARVMLSVFEDMGKAVPVIQKDDSTERVNTR